MSSYTHDGSWKKWALLFLASQNISLFGSSVTGLAIIWHVTLATSSGVMMTLVILASMLPQLFIAPWGGVWADRYNRKYLIMAADGGIALATLLLAGAYMAGYENMALLLGVCAIRSVGAGIQSPAVNAVIPQLVPEAHLTRFGGVNQSCNAAMQLLAPAVGGFVLAAFGLQWAFILDVVTAVFAVALLRFAPIGRVVETRKKSSAWQEMKEGFHYAWREPLLRHLIVCYGAAFILITPAAFLTPIMLERNFGKDVWLLTLHEIFWTGGTLFGGAYIAWKGAFKNNVRVIAVSLVFFGIIFALLGLARTFPVYLAFMAAAGLVLPFFTTAETVLIQRRVEPAMMGRVFSLLQVTALSAMPLAMLFFGPLADTVRIEAILVVTGAMLVLVGALFHAKSKND